jgi:hypothetical protein
MTAAPAKAIAAATLHLVIKAQKGLHCPNLVFGATMPAAAMTAVGRMVGRGGGCTAQEDF